MRHRAVATGLLLSITGCSESRTDLPGLSAVWGIHDGEKIGPDYRESPCKAANQAWDGRRVRVFGARNEVLAFQIIVESDGAGIHGLEVSLPALTLRGVVTFQWRDGTTISQTLSRPTSAGHKSLAGAEPPGFSAATCLLS